MNIHEPEANNCFSIITQVIIVIPKQRNVTILPQFVIVDKSSYHAARINVSRNAFLNSRSEEKNIFFDVHTGQKQIKMWFRGLYSYHYSFTKQCFLIASAC